jgi:hypothetical protein
MSRAAKGAQSARGETTQRSSMTRASLSTTNSSELALRRVALSRKNYLFVGDVAAGKSLADLYSLVATFEARGTGAPRDGREPREQGRAGCGRAALATRGRR